KEAVALITDALSRPPVGPYQLQAAIAALHDEAARSQDTDWPQIEALYERLLQESDNPMVRLNYAVAVAMARGPEHGLRLVDELQADPRLVEHHRLPAVRAHLLEMMGDIDAAIAQYQRAARGTASEPEQRYLTERAARLRESLS
ncbi:MAG: RNA polymerase sigma factor, partial [Corynebacteriales bacterium]|nr:RNA polymerase sigma factor [Mycobacteriales bacterium]